MPVQIKYNCQMKAPGQGQFLLWCSAVGHGFTVVSSESETRRFRTFYPNKRTSGTWYVDLMFGNHTQWQLFNFWLTRFINRAADPYKTTVDPIQVRVPSRGFDKRGFPVSAMDFGDDITTVLYRSRVSFTSASDPIDQDLASQFRFPSIRWLEDEFFAPSGLGTGDGTDPNLPNPWVGLDGPPEGDDSSVYEGDDPTKRVM